MTNLMDETELLTKPLCSIGANFLKYYLKLKTLKCNKFPAGKQCLLWKLFGVCCIPLFCLSSHPPLFHLSALLLSQKIFNLWRFVFRLPDIPKHCATSKNWQPQLISCPQIPQKLVGFFFLFCCLMCNRVLPLRLNIQMTNNSRAYVKIYMAIFGTVQFYIWGG